MRTALGELLERTERRSRSCRGKILLGLASLPTIDFRRHFKGLHTGCNIQMHGDTRHLLHETCFGVH